MRRDAGELGHHVADAVGRHPAALPDEKSGGGVLPVREVLLQVVANFLRERHRPLAGASSAQQARNSAGGLLLLLVGLGFVVWALPKVSEINIPLLGGSVVARLEEKLPPAPPPTRPAAGAGSAGLSPTAEALREAAGLKKQAVPASIINRAEEDDVYSAVGVERHTLYLSHRAQRLPRTVYRRLSMYLDADEPSTLDKIERVTYRLHPTFTPGEVTIADRAKAFTYELTAWGEFML